jgi:hypothetical protein
MQTNIRFSLTVRQLEIAMTEMINSLIQMNQEFLEEDMAMRILGENFRFAEFSQADKQVVVDARVKIKPKREKSPEQESKEVMELYENFVINDKPEAGADPDEIELWKKKKHVLQRLIVEKLGYEKYIDILAPAMKKNEEKKEPAAPAPRPPSGGLPAGGPPAPGMAGAPMPDDFRAQLPQQEAILPLEETAMPQATTSLTQPGSGNGIGGFLGKLLAGRNKRQ